MNFVTTADDVIEQILVQCFLYRAREGDRTGARGAAERTLERLLGGGLAYERGRGGALRLDPYAACNAIRRRKGEPADEAWHEWLNTGRCSAMSLPAAAHRYRLTLRRQWHAFNAVTDRPLILRLPLPLRQPLGCQTDVRVLEPTVGLMERHDAPGRIELRFSPTTRPPVTVELTVEFTAGELHDSDDPSALLGGLPEPADQLWLRTREALITSNPRVTELAGRLAQGARHAREYVHRAWAWMLGNLYCGDVLRSDLDGVDPLTTLFSRPIADCVLASSLLVALCRAQGVPARLLSGFLMHPAAVAPHSWVEAKLGPGNWAPFDFGSWSYCAGDVNDPAWGHFFRGRSDARFVAEIAPHEFTGWGSAPAPPRWFRLERLRDDCMEHTLHSLDTGAVVRRDQLIVEILSPDTASC